MMARPLFGEIAAISVADIDASDRLRPLDEAAVEALMVSIEQRNLEAPIIIRPHGAGWKLVAGGHRLEAVKRLGHEVIDAIPRNLDDDEARLAEIDENLIRRELSALDRAIFLAERKAVFDRMNPEQAKVLADVIDTPVSAAAATQKLIGIGFPAALATELGTQAHAGTGTVANLAGLGVPHNLAIVIKAAIDA